MALPDHEPELDAPSSEGTADGRSGESLDLYATCAFGLESVLAGELRRMAGARDAGELSDPPQDPKPDGPGMVRFRGTPASIAHANVRLRTAERVYVQLARATARDFDELFEAVRSVSWAAWVPADGGFPVRFRAVRSWLTSVPAGTRAVKRAVVESLMRAHNTSELPEAGAVFPIEARLVGDQLTLALDTTGEPLHRRGYRTVNAGPATLKQTLAAGIVLLSGWRPGRPLIDPFCGTGTIPIEAAWIATNRAPGRDRAFASEHWARVGDATFQDARERARTEEHPAPDGTRLFAYDRDEQAVATTRAHAERAGVAELIHAQERDVRELRTKLEHGVIVTNPPYGLRLDDRAHAEALYRALPAILQRLPTWSHSILTAHEEFERLVGQEATKRRKLYNGSIRCNLYSFMPERAKRAPGREPPAQDDPGEAGSKPVVRALGGAVAPAFGGLSGADRERLAQFEAVLAKRARHLRKWPERGIEAYRLYDRDVPGVAVTVDRYGPAVHIAEHQRATERTPASQAAFLDEVCKLGARALDADRRDVYLKTRRRQRDRQHTLDGSEGQYERVARDARTYVVREHDLRFKVNLSDYLDTGLFADHRITRAMVREQASGGRVLNLFAYTGSFSVAAAAGGAASITTVDMSNTYLDWACENFRLNSVDPNEPRFAFIKADAIASTASAEAGSFDLIIADAPTFSNSKSLDRDWDVARDHPVLLDAAYRALAPGGVLYFSCNARRFELRPESSAWSGVREITRQTLPEDFRKKGAHRAWRLVR